MRILGILVLVVGLACWSCCLTEAEKAKKFDWSTVPFIDCNGNEVSDYCECDQTAPYSDMFKCCKCPNGTEYIPALGNAEWGIPANTPWECVIANEAWRNEVRCDVCRLATWKDFCRVE